MAGNRPADWHVLDLDKDPTPGDPDRVRNLAKNLHDFADDVSKVLRDIKGMAGEDAILTWAGKTAESFTAEFEDAPGKLKKLKKSYEMAGDALSAYWPDLERAQALADKALVKGREAQGDLSSAQTRLTSADSWVDKAGKEADKYKDDEGKKDVPKPDPDKVKAATRNATAAEKAQTAAKSDVTAAQGNLDAAKKMAEDARKMREDAAGTAKKKLEEASDAGIQNRKWWEEVGDWVTDNWDTIVEVCKVVVAVVGIIAMIIGGPILAAIVVVAALVVLADTLNKYAKGEAGLLDVAFAALDCIPGMKGITSAAKLAKGLKGLKAGLKGLGKNGLRRGADDAVASSKSAKGRCRNGDPIDMISGEMLMSETDFTLPGVLGMGVGRTHLSTYRWGRWFGPSWTSTLDQRLELDDEGVLFSTEDGMILVYPVPHGMDEVLPLEGPRWPLSWDADQSGTLRVTNPASGISRLFAPVGRSPEHDTTFTMPIAAVSDRNGNRIEFEYAEDGSPRSMRHSGGYHVTIDSESDRVTGLNLMDSEGEQTQLVRYEYGDGRLVGIYNSSGLPYRYTYDDEDRITSWTDRNGSWYRYAYDDEHRVVRGEGIDGILNCTVEYDAEERCTRYTNSLGRVTSYRYNDQMQLVSSTNALGQSMTNEWDRYNRLISQTDALGNTTRYEYDGAGNLTTAIRPDGRVTQAEYNELNQIVHAVTAGGSTWRYRYDDRGNHTATVDYEGSETLYAYDEIGGLVAVTDVAGRTSLARCNTAGLPLEFTDAEGGTSRVERDSFGRVRSFTDPLGGVTRFGFTIEGRPVLREGADGFREISEWDAEGNLVSQADRAENSTRYKIGPFGQVVERTLSDGSTYSFGYDTELNLLHVSDPSERSWQYRYDEANRVTSETDFNGRTVAYELNAMGDLLSRTNGAGQVIEFRRDVLGRTLETHYDGEVSYYTYDEAGNLVREAGPDATVEREFSAAGQILSESIDGRTTTYEYDARGRRTKRRTPTGIESTWTYDEAGHPTALDTAGHRIDFGFDRAHRETARHLPGGVALTQTWDNAGRLAAQRLSRIPDQHAHPQDQDEVLLQQREYAYRPDGIPTEIRDLTTGTRRFTLDPAGRVTAVEARRWTETYQYDEVGNISHAATPGAEDTVGDRVLAGTRVQRAGRTRYEHDAEGRVVRVIHRLLSGRHRVQSYLWNSRNQLVGTTTPDGTRWRYRYDPAGRRVAKQRLDDEGSVADEVLFVWDDTRLIEQVTKNGRVTAWDYEPGGHRPVAQFDRADQDQDARFHAIVADLSGAPAELVSTDGEVAWQQRTLLWGGSLSAGLREETTAGSVDCPLRFEGQYADAETGWHYNFQRYYDPRIGQYVSSDPLGLAPAPNDRAYVPNPYRWADPLGLAWQDPNNGMRFGRDPSLPPADEDGREFTRSSQYPSDYRVSTHDHMVTHYTDEGRALNGVPRDSNNQRIPRDQLTWRDGDRNLLWDPRANNTQPFHRAVTYEHLDPVVAHWNREGRFSDRASRNDFYNNTDHMEPMNGRENSRGGGRMTDTYTQETGEGYSCS